MHLYLLANLDDPIRVSSEMTMFIQSNIPFLNVGLFFLRNVRVWGLCCNFSNILILWASLISSLPVLYSKFICAFGITVKSVSVVSDLSYILSIVVLFLFESIQLSFRENFFKICTDLFWMMMLSNSHNLLILMG